MGLMYLFPTTPEEKDHVVILPQSVTIKSYGLPYIFWGYAFVILMVEFAMFLAVKAPLSKLTAIGDSLDIFISFSLYTCMLFVPISLVAFFFYEKVLERKKTDLYIKYRIFGFTLKQTILHLKPDGIPFQVGHFIDSPNMARIKDEKAMKAFQNKGYYELVAVTKEEKIILIDRHSRKADLEKLVGLLELGAK
ncbi:MAG: hypothetical protein ACOYL6_07750 [Bacteriovoracaceae bacterium]